MTVSRKKSLIDEKSALERRLREINEELEKIHYDIKPLDKPNILERRVSINVQDETESPNKPLRQIIIGMLTDVGYMLNNTTIRHLYEARFQKGLAASRLGTLSHDEINRKNKWNTTVYGLNHPIQLVEGETIHVKNIWARSDWTVNQRVFLPTTDKLMQLHFLDWYTSSSNSRRYKYLKSPIMLRFIEGLIHNLELSQYMKPPYESADEKKMIVQEISYAKELQEAKYSALAFKVLAAHKQAKKHYRPGMYSDTDMLE
jgi:hypothetical protein